MGKIFSGLTFSQALELLLEGHKVTRSIWHHQESGVWVGMQPGYPDGVGANENTAKLLGVEPGTPVTICPYIVMRTVGGALVPWTPNMIDLMASDWNVVTAVGTAPEGWETVDRVAGAAAPAFCSDRDVSAGHDGEGWWASCRLHGRIVSGCDSRDLAAQQGVAHLDEMAEAKRVQLIREREGNWTPESMPCTIRDMDGGPGPDGWWVTCRRHGFKATGLPGQAAATEVLNSHLMENFDRHLQP